MNVELLARVYFCLVGTYCHISLLLRPSFNNLLVISLQEGALFIFLIMQNTHTFQYKS